MIEKYNVHITDTEKIGSTPQNGAQESCPDCGKQITNPIETNVRICPVCGTLPYEESDVAKNP